LTAQTVLDVAADFWQEHAHLFVKSAQQADSFFVRRAQLTAALIVRHCSPCTALDVGCGTGLLSYELALRGFDVYGTDIAPNMLAAASAHTAAVLSDSETRFRLTQGSTAPFLWQFDLIAAVGVFPYVPDYNAYLNYLTSQLKPGGYIVASCINRFSLCTLKLVAEHLLKKRNDGWREVLLNLVRTGVWSGGFVDYDECNQVYCASAFEAIFKAQNFAVIESFDLYNIGCDRIDRGALVRSNFQRALARNLAWCHVGLFKSES
jgi:2-polyprenyl-3-methyl-5-hydroxy-6-metoxy-1,4-benzoquinol methylase